MISDIHLEEKSIFLPVIQDSCVICLDSSNVNIITTPCNHKYHYGCIERWAHQEYREYGQTTCPVCREFGALKSTTNNYRNSYYIS
jgi:hypothetical protein